MQRGAKQGIGRGERKNGIETRTGKGETERRQTSERASSKTSIIFHSCLLVFIGHKK